MRTLDAMNLRLCLLLALATSCLASVPGVDASGGLGTEFLESWQWRRVDVRRGVGSEAITALAADREGEVLAVGGEGGVSLFRNGAWQERLSRVGLVTDLAFAQDGTLWVGTPRRLWRYSSSGQLQQQSPGQGEAARFIHRIATLGALTVVTTEAGAYVHGEPRSWERLGTDLPRSSGGAVALRWLPRARSESPGIAEVWLVVGGQLWRTTLREGGPVPEAPSFASARVVTIPDVPVAEVPSQIVLGLKGVDVLLVYARMLVYRTGAETPWRVVRPVGVPGASFQWLAHAGSLFWLGTSGGILHSALLDGRWWRAAPPVSAFATVRLLSFEGRVLAATERGLYEGRQRPRELGLPRPARQRAFSSRRDPDILQVQNAAVAHQGLEPRYMGELRSGLARRGWWPDLSLRLQSAVVRESGADFDQSYVSGGTRHLRDREHAEAMDIDASLVLTWALGDVVFNPESVDLSREARQVISLRDDVLDQVNQLYYERQAILLALEAQPDPRNAEASRLRLRAAELAAGLDGWTGGWFRRQLQERWAGEELVH